MLNYWIEIVIERDEKMTNRLYKSMLSLSNSIHQNGCLKLNSGQVWNELNLLKPKCKYG